MATVKAGWAMHPKPVFICGECGRQVIAEAYDDGGEVQLAWACGNGCTYDQIDWPFEDGFDDFEMQELIDLGFVPVA